VNADELKSRFMKFALNIVRLTEKFPRKTVYFIVERQLIRCGSFPGANYNSACRSKSGPDFINKLKIVEEELDESIFWLDFLCGVDPVWLPVTADLRLEAGELLSIIVASIKTSRKNLIKIK
jgi:four helix bundle protein